MPIIKDKIKTFFKYKGEVIRLPQQHPCPDMPYEILLKWLHGGKIKKRELPNKIKFGQKSERKLI